MVKKRVWLVLILMWVGVNLHASEVEESKPAHIINGMAATSLMVLGSTTYYLGKLKPNYHARQIGRALIFVGMSWGAFGIYKAIQ